MVKKFYEASMSFRYTCFFYTMKSTFSKAERLKSRKDIAELFASGEALFSYPIKWVYKQKEVTRSPSVRMGVSVSRRIWRRAVDRNRIKRLLREVYRLNKSKIVSTLSDDEHLNGMLLYVAKEELPFSEIEAAFLHIIEQWVSSHTS